MKQNRKLSVISIFFPILLISMVLMIIACEWTITASGNELRAQALDTCRAEIGYIGDALYSQLTSIQMQNVEILNHESVLALSLRSSILDKYEMVSHKNTVMKLIRSKLSQLNLTSSAQLYIPAIHTIITPQKAAEATAEEMEALLGIVRDFPDGLYYSEESMGFWSASPLIHDASVAQESRIMLTSIQRNSLKALLQKYAAPSRHYQLLLAFGDHVIVSSLDHEWDERMMHGENEIQTVLLDGRQYYIMQVRHAFSDLSIIAAMPVDSVMSNMVRHQVLLRTLEAVCVLIFLFSTLAFYRIICRPLKGMSVKLGQAGKGDLSVRMPPEKTAELNEVSVTFNEMAERLSHLIDREYKARLLAADAEKKALQYQISPHFLYNTYFQLRNLILLEEKDQAQRLADLMGRYLRYIVRRKDASATLGDEMDHARNYADIQRMRFGDRIEVHYDIPEGVWRDMEVPRLLVQPLIENSFSHGLKEVETNGLIRLSLRQAEGTVEISVEDNGESFPDSNLQALREAVTQKGDSAEDGVALRNIHRRLQLYFGPESGLFFARSSLGGLQVTIRIRNGKE